MISVNYQGRLGNNLFQYAVACLLSKKFDQRISNPIPNRIIKFDNSQNDHWHEKTAQVNCDNFQEIYEQDSIDFNIYLNGSFQNRYVTNIFRENRSLFVEIGPDKLYPFAFVHIRLGDLLNHNDIKNNMPDYDYYSKSLEGFYGGYVSSDSPDHPIVIKIANEFGLKIFSGSPEDTILFGAGFLHKVLSLGTFSWWVGFLGNSGAKATIQYPDPESYTKWHGDIFDF